MPDSDFSAHEIAHRKMKQRIQLIGKIISMQSSCLPDQAAGQRMIQVGQNPRSIMDKQIPLAAASPWAITPNDFEGSDSERINQAIEAAAG